MTNDLEPRHAVIYARVSTVDQDCSRQVRDLTAFAERAGYIVDGTYTETASGAKNDRQQRAAIIKMAQARKIDAVLVTEMSRWGRSLPDLLSTLQQLNAWGVSVVAATGFSFELSTPQGKLMAGILGSLAEFERDLLRERINSGLANAKAKGKKLGRPEGNHAIKKHSKKALALLSAGKSIRQVAEDLGCSTRTVQDIKQAASA